MPNSVLRLSVTSRIGGSVALLKAINPVAFARDRRTECETGMPTIETGLGQGATSERKMVGRGVPQGR